MDAQIEQTHFEEILFARLSTVFASLAILPASIGLYGVTALAVARRTQELGIRIALGATRGGILLLVLREVVWMTAVGLAVGTILAYGLGKTVESAEAAATAVHASTFLGAALLFGKGATLMTWLAALRARRIDPVVPLRHK